MFKDIYKAANNKITPDKQLVEKIIFASEKSNSKINLISLYALALAMVLICISLNPLYLNVSKDNLYETDTTKVKTAATAVKQKFISSDLSNNKLPGNEAVNESLNNAREIPDDEAGFGNYPFDDQLLNLPEHFKETNEINNQIFSFSATSEKKVLYANSSLPVLNPSNTNPYFIGKTKAYVYKKPPFFYAEFSSGYNNYINIWAKNITEEEFYNLIR